MKKTDFGPIETAKIVIVSIIVMILLVAFISTLLVWSMRLLGIT